MKPKAIIIGVLVLLVLIILIQNTEVVTFNLLFWQIGMSRIIMLFLSLLIGFLIGFLARPFIVKDKAKEDII
jgi:uncharacterized integral membrane protein